MAFNVLSGVNDVALKIGASQELSEIVQFTLGKVLEVVQIEAGSVYLLDDQRAELSVAASRGLSEEAERDFDHLRIGEGLSGRPESRQRWTRRSSPPRLGLSFLALEVDRAEIER